MRHVSALTRKGQVTIPKAIREAAGLKPHDRIGFAITNGAVEMRRARLSLDEMAGMLPPIGIQVEEMPAVAWDTWVREFAEENR